MDILKLVLVFCVIIGVMWMKKPMWMAVIAASVATIFLYGLSPDVAVHGIIKGATARATVETLVVFYSITFLQRMMEKRKNLSNAQVAMNGLFNNNRVNASIVPFLLGMLPAASTVLICGPIVRESVKDSDLSVPEQACITSYFRHIFRSFCAYLYQHFYCVGDYRRPCQCRNLYFSYAAYGNGSDHLRAYRTGAVYPFNVYRLCGNADFSYSYLPDSLLGRL